MLLRNRLLAGLAALSFFLAVSPLVAKPTQWSPSFRVVSSPPSPPSVAIDPNGNTVSKTKDGVTTTFKYDIRDQLGEVLQGTDVLGRYGYDYDGRRILKIGDEGRVHYTYDQLSVITEADDANATVSKYDYGLDQLVSLNNRVEGRSFFHLDVLRSTANLTDGIGNTKQSILYDAWGNERDRIGISSNRFTFTGHELDEETGLIYANARFFEPDIGRFLSQDILIGNPLRPPSLHRYAYALMNPLRFFDLTGNEGVEVTGWNSTIVTYDANLTTYYVGAATGTESVTVRAFSSRSEAVVYRTGQILTPATNITNDVAIRTLGVAQATGGVGQIVLGGIGVLAPEPFTSVAGGVAIGRGVDNIQAGLRTAGTGEFTETYSGTLIRKSAEFVGFSEENAVWVSTGAEIALDFGSTAGSGRAALKNVRQRTGGTLDDFADDVGAPGPRVREEGSDVNTTATPATETPQQPPIPEKVYRGGGKSPSNLTPRAVDEGMLSTRDSLSNPWPLEPGQKPPLPVGKPIQVIDTSKLPPGTVIPDGAPYGPQPQGHVSIGPNVQADVVKDAIVETIPKSKIK